MEYGDYDNALFGTSALQSCLQDALSDGSGDELLFAPTEDEPDSWWLQNSSQLMPATTTSDSDEHFDTDNVAGHIGVETHNTTYAQGAPRDRNWVIARIESVLEKVADGLLEESEPLTITLKSRSALSRRRTNALDSEDQHPEPKHRDISFPGATVLLRILELVHGGLVDNTIMTKRDIYYRHPDLFLKQTVVDRYVDDLACTFGITRSQLNVVRESLSRERLLRLNAQTAAAKGLVAGNFKLIREDGHELNCMNEKEGMLVPKIGDNDSLRLASVKWLLVVEKEACAAPTTSTIQANEDLQATFRSLLSSSNWKLLRSHGVILTGKGYPDIASRRFLRQVADHSPHIPMYAFVDLDPDGIAILSTYKYGSYRLAHEDVTLKATPALSLPDIRWLGVKSHHISRAPVGESSTDTSALPELQGLMKLSPRDRAKAARMLEWDLCVEGGPEQDWRQELQRMLMVNIKAEMQILDELPGGLVSWLSDELSQASRQGFVQPIDSACSDDGMLF
ncbi:Nn.00g082840.m01.CDS01 [Neocucurbitaria sp. VM-36]